MTAGCPLLTNLSIYAIIAIASTMSVTWCGMIGERDAMSRGIPPVAPAYKAGNGPGRRRERPPSGKPGGAKPFADAFQSELERQRKRAGYVPDRPADTLSMGEDGLRF